MQKFLVFMTVLACLFLSLIGGAFVAYFELIPGLSGRPQTDEKASLQGLAAADRVPVGINHPALLENLPKMIPVLQHGVLRHDASRAWGGYTLISPASQDIPVRLIDMEGATVHQWKIPTALQIQPDTIAASGKFPQIVRAHLLDDGELIIAVSSADPLGGNGGIGRIDQAGQLLWHYRGPVGGAFAVTPADEVYALLRNARSEPWPGLERIATPFFDDVLLQLDNSGTEIRRISLLEAIQNSPFIYLLQYADPDRHGGDLLGVSDVGVLNAEQAASLPHAAAGDILISLQQLDVIAVLDPDVPAVKWAARGAWHLQGDTDVLDNGNVLLFDSHGDLARGGGSRVLEIDPVSLGTVWEFPGNSGELLLSSFGGSQQRLPNGNTLISDARNRRVLEVTAGGSVVWEYRLPQDASGGLAALPQYAVLATRYKTGQLAFLQQTSGVSQ